jgi:uncharacterized membrane protein YbhN (UPF0104 family)
MRRLLFLLVISLGAYFIFSRAAEVEQVIHSFREGDPAWLALAVAVQFVWMLNVGASFWVIYRILGLREGFFHMGLVAMSAQFVSVVAPSGGMGGVAVLIADGNKRGLRSGRVTTGGALFVFFEQSSLLAVVLLGLFFLFRLNQLSTSSVLAMLVLAGIALVTGLVLVMGMRSPVLLANVLTRLGNFLNRMLQPNPSFDEILSMFPVRSHLLRTYMKGCRQFEKVRSSCFFQLRWLSPAKHYSLQFWG